MSKNIGIILAGGIGSRFNAKVPKQYMKLNGKELVAYSIDAFRNSKTLSDFICIVNEEEFNERNIENKYGVKCVKGGNSRNESLSKGLEYIKHNKPECEKIIIHEAARPFINSHIVDFYLEELDNHDAVITTVKITDSIGTVSGDIVERDRYHLIQAPEAFWYKDLANHFKGESKITATIHQLPKNMSILYNYDFRLNMKVTYTEDLFLAEQLARLKYYEDIYEEKALESKLKDKKILLFGASGGVGSALYEEFKKVTSNIKYPTSKELDFETITVEDIRECLGEFQPDIIINAAAFSANDEDGLLEMFDKVFKINLKSNLTIIEYAKSLSKEVNIVLFSSSSSTKGRKGITLYSAAKVGINSIVESLAEEMKNRGIYINAIIPEKINTPMIQKLHKTDISNRELLDVSEVIEAVKYYSTAKVSGDLVHIRKGL